MPDLSTTYLGLNLPNPLVPSASPLTRKLDTLRKLEAAGASAVVLYSLFEEQAILESHLMDLYLSQGTESFGEALTYLPEAQDYRTGPEEYLEHVFKAKQALGIPVIASLNGYSPGGWVRYAKEMEQAGADALELNMYFVATDPSMSGRAVEDMYVQLLSDIRATLKIPIAVKLSPFFSALPNMAMRLEKAGARGLVLFNRFYQPDIDIEMLDPVPHLTLSTSDELQPVQSGRAKPEAALDRRAVRQGGLRPGPDLRRPHGRGCDQGPAGRRLGDHDGVRAAGAWGGSPDDRAARGGALADRA